MSFLFALKSLQARQLAELSLPSASRSLADAAHHLHELFEVNLAVAIIVDFCNGLVELFLCVHVSEHVSSQETQELFRIDLPTAVFVKHLKGSLEVGLSGERLRVHCGRQELYNNSN